MQNVGNNYRLKITYRDMAGDITASPMVSMTNARCGKQCETEACLEEHDKGVHERISIVCAKGVHGVGNNLRQGVACRSMVGEDMCAVEVDVQCVGKCVRNRNTYRNILRRNMRGLKGKEEVEGGGGAEGLLRADIRFLEQAHAPQITGRWSRMRMMCPRTQELVLS